MRAAPVGRNTCRLATASTITPNYSRMGTTLQSTLALLIGLMRVSTQAIQIQLCSMTLSYNIIGLSVQTPARIIYLFGNETVSFD